MNNNKFLSTIKSTYFVVDTNLEIDIAFIKNFIPNNLMEEIEQNLNYLYNYKTTIYSGILDNSMPFNYITADSSTDIGIHLQTVINTRLNETINNLLTIISPKTKNYLLSLDPRFSLMNNNVFPTTVINFLEPSDTHRIVKAHKDNLDVGVSILFYFGSYKEDEGYLELPDQQCKIFCRPGDVLVFKGNKYKHKVSDISSGKRIGLVYFTHKGNKTKPYYESTQKTSLKQHREIYPKEPNKRTKKKNSNK